MKKLVTLILLVFISVSHLNIIDNISYLHEILNTKKDISLKKSCSDKDAEKDEESEKEIEKETKEKGEEKFLTHLESYCELLAFIRSSKKYYFPEQLFMAPFIEEDGPPPNTFI